MKENIVILISMIGVMLSSCGIDEETRTEFIIRNNSAYAVELIVYDAQMPNQNPKDVTFNLNNNTEISYYYILEGENGPINEYPLGATADSAYINFNSNSELQIVYRKNDLNPRNILDINSWDEVKESNTYYIYTYTITDEDNMNKDLIL